jgi:hypothetical protein
MKSKNRDQKSCLSARSTKIFSTFGYTNIFFADLIVDKNIIGAPKMRNNYGAIQFLIFSIAPCTVIALHLPCFIFCISSLLLFVNNLSKVIALVTIPREYFSVALCYCL